MTVRRLSRKLREGPSAGPQPAAESHSATRGPSSLRRWSIEPSPQTPHAAWCVLTSFLDGRFRSLEQQVSDSRRRHTHHTGDSFHKATELVIRGYTLACKRGMEPAAAKYHFDFDSPFNSARPPEKFNRDSSDQVSDELDSADQQYIQLQVCYVASRHVSIMRLISNTLHHQHQVPRTQTRAKSYWPCQRRCLPER